MKEHARSAVVSFGGVAHSDHIDEAAEKNASEIDEVLEDSWERTLDGAVDKGMPSILKILDETRIHNFLQSTEYTAVKLEGIDEVSQRIIHQLPGVQFDLADPESPLRVDLDLFRRQNFELVGDPLKLRFMTCRVLQNLISRWDDGGLSDEKIFEKFFWPKNALRRQLWHLQDLRDGGGLGFAVELFLQTLKQLLSTFPSHESYSQLYTTTLKTIASDWRKYKHSLGTQKLLLDAVTFHQGFLRGFNYPEYIVDELWELLGDMLEGQTGPHISSAVQQVTDHQAEGHRYGPKAEAVISRWRASCSQEPSNPTETA